MWGPNGLLILHKFHATSTAVCGHAHYAATDGLGSAVTGAGEAGLRAAAASRRGPAAGWTAARMLSVIWVQPARCCKSVSEQRWHGHCGMAGGRRTRRRAQQHRGCWVAELQAPLSRATRRRSGPSCCSVERRAIGPHRLCGVESQDRAEAAQQRRVLRRELRLSPPPRCPVPMLSRQQLRRV